MEHHPLHPLNLSRIEQDRWWMMNNNDRDARGGELRAALIFYCFKNVEDCWTFFTTLEAIFRILQDPICFILLTLHWLAVSPCRCCHHLAPYLWLDGRRTAQVTGEETSDARIDNPRQKRASTVKEPSFPGQVSCPTFNYWPVRSNQLTSKCFGFSSNGKQSSRQPLIGSK